MRYKGRMMEGLPIEKIISHGLRRLLSPAAKSAQSVAKTPRTKKIAVIENLRHCIGMFTKITIAMSCLLLVLPAAGAKDEKLTPEELVSKHLESIGPAAKRMAAKSRSTGGTVQVAFRVGGSGTLNGKGNILSQGNAVRLGFGFSALDYSGEQIAFDGNKISVGQISPGNYPPFSRFVYENDLPLKEGLLLGTLSTNWALLAFSEKKPKLDLSGPKKIDGRQLYELKYQSRTIKGSMQVWLYFEPETFRHVRSQFKLETPLTSVARISDSAEVVRYQILEQFDQFKEVDGLTLPHSYKVDYTIDSPRGGLLTSWNYVVDRVSHNETIENRIFSVQ
jgi:hypothetical protein